MSIPKKDLTPFSTILKELREQKNLTQEQLAKILKTSKQSIWNYEANHREPNIEMLISIANHFNVSVDYLLGRSEYQNHSDKNFNAIIAEKTNIPDESLSSVIDLIEIFLELIKASTIYPLPINPPLYYESPNTLMGELKKCILFLIKTLNLNLLDVIWQHQLKSEKASGDTDFVETEKKLKSNAIESNKSYGDFSILVSNYILELKYQCNDLLESDVYSNAAEPQKLIPLILMYLNQK